MSSCTCLRRNSLTNRVKRAPHTQDAPSCSKQISAFDAALDEYKALGVSVVGVRNEGGVKDSAADASVSLVVDEADAVRNDAANYATMGQPGAGRRRS